MGSRAFVLLLVAGSAAAFLSYGKTTWTTIFFQRTHGMTPGEVGFWFGLWGGLAGMLGTWLGGWLAWALSPTYRRRFLDNVRQAGLGWPAVLGAVGQAGCMSAELPRLWLGRPAPLQWAEDQAAMDAYASGKGVLFLTPHMGCFEITAQAVAQNAKSHVDDYSRNVRSLYGIIEADLGPSTVASLAFRSRRWTTMSTMPCSCRYSARWNPSGSFSRIVSWITRWPAKPIRQPGSAICTSPSMA